MVRFRFVPRALPGLGPMGKGKLRRKPAGGKAAFPFRRPGPVLEPKQKCPPEGGLHPGPGPQGQGLSTEQAFSPAILMDRMWPVCQVPHSQEAPPLCLMPAGKQEASPFVAIAGLVSLQVGQSSHWLLSFIF